MLEILKSIITNALIALYQPFWFAAIMAVLIMFFLLYSHDSDGAGKGCKVALKYWKQCFLNSSKFRKMFFLVFYSTLILFRTLLNRELWTNPLSNVLGTWWIYRIDNNTGEMVLTTEGIENIMLFLPFSILLLWYKNENNVLKGNIIISATLSTFIFSILIECAQLVFRLGTFQISDLFFNTLGGCLGGVFFWLWKRKKSL